MTTSTDGAALYEAGDAWLADCSVHPDLVRRAWDAEALAPTSSGEHWLVAESHLANGLPAVVRIREEQCGPIVADGVAGKAWWLVPTTAAEALADVRQFVVRPACWVLRCPPAGVFAENRFWLWRPDGSGRLTDPTLPAAALGPGGECRLSEETT
ncbi:hypothetical protein [Streptomyces bluensis]|uniref:hypothetical protein n=1 Tax=Streptomyces bluensis TaxID=33897 RepID=UPI003321CA4E